MRIAQVLRMLDDGAIKAAAQALLGFEERRPASGPEASVRERRRFLVRSLQLRHPVGFCALKAAMGNRGAEGYARLATLLVEGRLVAVRAGWPQAASLP